LSAVLLVLDIKTLGTELISRPYIVVGFLAFIVITVLAVTSPKAMVKKLGRNWKKLHKLIYLASILVLVLFFWLNRADYSEPVFYAFILSLLLAYRIFREFAALPKARRKHLNSA